jgi:hypothetical protein
MGTNYTTTGQQHNLNINPAARNDTTKGDRGVTENKTTAHAATADNLLILSSS